MVSARYLAAVLISVVLGASVVAAQTTDAAPAAGQRVAVDGGEYVELKVDELEAMLAAKDFPLVNVHIPFEGDLPQTDYSIPYNDIEGQLEKLPAAKDATIVLYCRTGSMSSRAAAVLARFGYTRVYHLAGGFRAWIDAGLPMAGN